MARACCAALGGFAVPAPGCGFVCSAQREEATVLATLLFDGFGRVGSAIFDLAEARQSVLDLETY